MNEKQNFSYHTHTNRCGHAGSYVDKDYVDAARKVGLTSLGFSCHAPYNSLKYQNAISNMSLLEAGDYIRSIKELKEAYTDLDIIVGFEADFLPEEFETLIELRDEVDYMILGQHDLGVTSVKADYPISYAENVCAAMESGIFDMVAHPDIFLMKRDAVGISEKEEFDKNATTAMRMICDKARDLEIPLEINIRGFKKNKAYPSREFFKICASSGAKVCFGCDAHSPQDIYTFQDNINDCLAYLDLSSNLSFLRNSYDPVNYRMDHGFDKLYSKFKSDVRIEGSSYRIFTAKFYEAKRVLSELIGMCHDADDLLAFLRDTSKEQCTINRIDNDYKSVKNNLSTYYGDKLDSFNTTRLFEKVYPSLANTFEKRKKLNEEIADLVVESKKHNITDINDCVKFVLYKLEATNTRNGQKQVELNSEINKLIDAYTVELEGGNEKGAKKTLSSPWFKASTEEEFNGFTNIAIVGLVVSFIIGFGIGIAYILMGL